METLILIIHITLSVFLIGLVLLQQGKGADAGAAFGASTSQTVFGGRGSTSFLVKITSFIALGLLVTCIALYILTKQKVNYVADALLNTNDIPAVIESSDMPSMQSEDVKQDKPAEQSGKVNDEASSVSSDTIKQ
ncbi:MAG: preprotein translocase subunit SecG [Endozoicomonadaceae bacterium]|nr:preprotein translocase subunit SecG [Endozoicomonadaceae bacterium]